MEAEAYALGRDNGISSPLLTSVKLGNGGGRILECSPHGAQIVVPLTHKLPFELVVLAVDFAVTLLLQPALLSARLRLLLHFSLRLTLSRSPFGSGRGECVPSYGSFPVPAKAWTTVSSSSAAPFLLLLLVLLLLLLVVLLLLRRHTHTHTGTHAKRNAPTHSHALWTNSWF